MTDKLHTSGMCTVCANCTLKCTVWLESPVCANCTLMSTHARAHSAYAHRGGTHARIWQAVCGALHEGLQRARGAKNEPSVALRSEAQREDWEGLRPSAPISSLPAARSPLGRRWNWRPNTTPPRTPAHAPLLPAPVLASLCLSHPIVFAPAGLCLRPHRQAAPPVPDTCCAATEGAHTGTGAPHAPPHLPLPERPGAVRRLTGGRWRSAGLAPASLCPASDPQCRTSTSSRASHPTPARARTRTGRLETRP